MKVKTTKVVFKLHPEVAQGLRDLVRANPPLTLSGFAQDAIVMRMRSYRPATEFISEGREDKGRSAAQGSLDLTLDRPDGVPLTHAHHWTFTGWRDLWLMSSDRSIKSDINAMRKEQEREPLTDAEWKAIVRYMKGGKGD